MGRWGGGTMGRRDGGPMGLLDGGPMGLLDERVISFFSLLPSKCQPFIPFSEVWCTAY